MNGTVKDIKDYTMYLGKPEGDEGKIDFTLNVGNYLYGTIVKIGKDAEGDLYQVNDASRSAWRIFGKTGQDEEDVLGPMYRLKRMKFSDKFAELTITCAPNTIIFFKRFLPERKPHETSTLLAQ